MNLGIKFSGIKTNKLSLETAFIMVVGTGLIATTLLYLLRVPIKSVIPISNTYYVFTAMSVMLLAQILIVLISWSKEGILGNRKKLKEKYPYLKFSWRNRSLLGWLFAFGVATITFIITFDIIEPTIGVWFRTIVTPPNWHPMQPNMPLDVNIDGLFIIIMGFVLLLNVISEDIFFRCFLLQKVSWLGKWDWVFVGLLFGAYHLLFQPWQLPGILPAALMMTWWTKYLKSVWPALVGHLLVNGFQIIGFIIAAGSRTNIT